MTIEIEKQPPKIGGKEESGAAENTSAPSLAEAQFPARIPRLAFSVRETAETLGVSEKTVRRLVARRLLNPSRALRHLLISRKEVERFLTESSA